MDTEFSTNSSDFEPFTKFKAKRKSPLLLVLLSLLVVGTGIVVGSPAARVFKETLGATTGVALSFSPSGTTTISKGQVLTVVINMDTKGADVTGVELAVSYPTQNLTVKSVTPGSQLSLLKNPTQSGGTIRMTLGSNCTTTCTKANGAGSLVSIKFDTISQTSGAQIKFAAQTVTAALGSTSDTTNRSSLAPLTVVIR